MTSCMTTECNGGLRESYVENRFGKGIEVLPTDFYIDLPDRHHSYRTAVMTGYYVGILEYTSLS
jgi:hypothetical protein